MEPLEPLDRKIVDWDARLTTVEGMEELPARKGPGRPKGSKNRPKAPEPPPEPESDWTAERVRKGIALPLRIICDVCKVERASDEELDNLSASLAPAIEKHADSMFGQYYEETMAVVGIAIFAGPRVIEYMDKRKQHKPRLVKTEDEKTTGPKLEENF